MTTTAKQKATATTRNIRSSSWDDASNRRRPLHQLSDTPSIPLCRNQKDGRLHLQKPRVKLRNNLLAAVGYIELANAGDFAANVFNMRPIPIYAVVLMAIGGTVALGMIYFVIKDARLSWQNIQGLRAERRFLLEARGKQETEDSKKIGCISSSSSSSDGTDRGGTSVYARTLECLLHVNYRDLGAEVIDRFGMDVLLGFGALVVGVGTYMAIGGDDPVIFNTSNLLTGYIGNSPIALYGLVNMGWSGFVWLRAKHHGMVVTAASGAHLDARVKSRLKLRARRVQLHGMLNGVTGVVAGAASLVTATQWWAYIILGPCILVSAYCNRLWRYHVGYDRPFFTREVAFTEDDVVSALKEVGDMESRIADQSGIHKDDVESAVDPVVSLLASESGSSFRPLFEFIVYMNLFEDFCKRLLDDDKIMDNFHSDPAVDTVTLDGQKLLEAEDAQTEDHLMQLAQNVIGKDALKNLKYREGWLLEVLGCYMALGPSERMMEAEENVTDRPSVDKGWEDA
ncbi:hypothetical protein QBC42DRAFT_339847 [Cladorrhinum samala]|uniref:Integral membrane protein n=1 Tax=Cladorrhinum samala TaxID=585594 RepID=A0AAV9HHF4_9PEZI|nr:hypothetical protein QBC42DRAFT_339847 [Cladorrhinum samala]